MSESTPAPMNARRVKRTFGTAPWWVMVLLGLAIVALFVIPMLFAPRGDAPEGEAFGGTDGKVTEVLEENGHEAWFTPLFEPGSGEVESGLFALQAALGAGVVGYVVGRLHERRKSHPSPDATGPTPESLPRA